MQLIKYFQRMLPTLHTTLRGNNCQLECECSDSLEIDSPVGSASI